ncbi:MAG: rRNA (guanine527-N7)-methyltransferase [Solirubrobacteraceae bacterium]|jgi:16S rRNA (guanine527-N7)-methyltransferase|nr:rRNA (guanine527-N7)-methyltransferase [Solirubrobacteraceae bacterium]
MADGGGGHRRARSVVSARKSSGRVDAAVGELARRYSLPSGSEQAFVALIDLLARDEHAPTSVRDPRAVVDAHLADSLVALELPEVRRARVIADVGSGAGFPGLPLAVALPQARVALVESNARRAAFLERAAAATGSARARVVNARVEEWEEGLGANDLVVVRALAPLPVVAEYAAPLLALGGAVVAWRGRRDDEAERAAARAAADLGLEPAEPRRVAPYPGAEHRYLHLMSKVRETPARFPRRAGMALKRPLGAERR